MNFFNRIDMLLLANSHINYVPGRAFADPLIPFERLDSRERSNMMFCRNYRCDALNNSVGFFGFQPFFDQSAFDILYQ